MADSTKAKKKDQPKADSKKDEKKPKEIKKPEAKIPKKTEGKKDDKKPPKKEGVKKAKAKAPVKAQKKKTTVKKVPQPRPKKVEKKKELIDLKIGKVRFGRAKKAALDKLLKRKTKPTEKKEKKPLYVIKSISGEKNGGSRKVLLQKPPRSYPLLVQKRKHPKDVHKKKSKQKLRASLKKGTICIMLAGLHKGKRVVFLKQLPSGLCLVTGPYLVNGCPLRRINQNYLIATSLRLRLPKFKLPSKVNDDYFKRIKLNKKTKKDQEDIFEKKKEKFTTSKKRYLTQSVVDKPILRAVLRHPESRVLKRYLHTKFLLQNKSYPHLMKF